jgi:hypothetical protein
MFVRKKLRKNHGKTFKYQLIIGISNKTYLVFSCIILQSVLKFIRSFICETIGTDDDLIDSLEVRARSASLGSQDSDHIGDNGFTRSKKRSATSGTIDNSVNVVTLPLTRRLSGEKRIISFPSNLDVVNEESDFKDSKSTVNRSSLSSECK